MKEFVTVAILGGVLIVLSVFTLILSDLHECRTDKLNLDHPRINYPIEVFVIRSKIDTNVAFICYDERYLDTNVGGNSNVMVTERCPKDKHRSHYSINISELQEK